VYAQFWEQLRLIRLIREAVFENQHSIIVQKGLKLGMVLFIVSEIMFFFAFFWAFFHELNSSVLSLSSNVHNWFNKKVNFNFIIQKAYLLVKDLSTLRSKRELRTRRFISQWIKTDCNLLYNVNFALRFYERSGGLTN